MKEVLQKNNHLKVGLNISLHEEVADKSNYYETLLIGWKKDRFLVGDTPVLSGKPVSIPKGSYFIGHFQSYRTVYGFETSVLDVKTEPYPIIFLAYPDIVKEMYLRRHQRTKINTPASIYSIVTRNGSIMDISEGLSSGNRVFLRCRGPVLPLLCASRRPEGRTCEGCCQKCEKKVQQDPSGYRICRKFKIINTFLGWKRDEQMSLFSGMPCKIRHG